MEIVSQEIKYLLHFIIFRFIDYCEQNNALIEWGANLVDFDASVLDGFAKLSINEW